jgi:hypothetical protein
MFCSGVSWLTYPMFPLQTDVSNVLQRVSWLTYSMLPLQADVLNVLYQGELANPSNLQSAGSKAGCIECIALW